MNKELAIILGTFFFTISLLCGIFLFIRRKDVPDRSRLFLSLFCFVVGVCAVLYIIQVITGTLQRKEILMPVIPVLGLYAITMFLCYPVEVIRPRQLKGRWLLLLFTPSLLVTLPLLFGISFQPLYSWSDFTAHWSNPDVLLRLLAVLFVAVISFLLLALPYNWSQTSADRRWILGVTIMAQVISVLYFANAFTNLPFFLYLHMLVSIIIIVYLVYYELMERIIPPEKSELSAVEKALLAAREPLDGDLWPQICQAMDKWEIWRDPNTTVETLCADIGTNRIYAANSIREHTGLTFNDYLNKKRIDFMADQLRSNPTLDQKALYFDAGYRNRQTAYRNFVKFMGCSPSEFIAKG